VAATRAVLPLPHAANWVAVKERWSLSADERERVTVGNLLRDCERG
jgi:hypothetical protein